MNQISMECVSLYSRVYSGRIYFIRFNFRIMNTGCYIFLRFVITRLHWSPMPASPVYVLRIGTTLVWVDKTRDGNKIGSPDRARRSADNGLSRNVCEVGISTNEGFVIMNVDGAIQLMSLLVSFSVVYENYCQTYIYINIDLACPQEPLFLANYCDRRRLLQLLSKASCGGRCPPILCDCDVSRQP